MATTYDPFLLGMNQGLYHEALLSNAPGGNIIRQEMTGYLPADVLANIYQSGAERGVISGMPGSPNTNAATMRALGLTSVDLQQKGLENALALYGASPRLPAAPTTTPPPPTLPHDTAYPMGGGGAPGPVYRGAVPTTPTEPAAPTSGYDTYLYDWLRRSGYGGGGVAPVVAPPTTPTTTGTTTAGAGGGGALEDWANIAGPEGIDLSNWADIGGEEGIDLTRPDWWSDYLETVPASEQEATDYLFYGD